MHWTSRIPLVWTRKAYRLLSRRFMTIYLSHHTAHTRGISVNALQPGVGVIESTVGRMRAHRKPNRGKYLGTIPFPNSLQNRIWRCYRLYVQYMFLLESYLRVLYRYPKRIYLHLQNLTRALWPDMTYCMYADCTCYSNKASCSPFKHKTSHNPCALTNINLLTTLVPLLRKWDCIPLDCTAVEEAVGRSYLVSNIGYDYSLVKSMKFPEYPTCRYASTNLV